MDPMEDNEYEGIDDDSWNESDTTDEDEGPVLLPDNIWVEILALVDLPSDKMRASAACRRLRELVTTERRIWKEWQRIYVYCGVSIIRVYSDGKTVYREIPGDQRKAQTVFHWLFSVCRPQRLIFQISPARRSEVVESSRSGQYENMVAVYGRLLRDLGSAMVDGRNGKSPVERLTLDLRYTHIDYLEVFNQLLPQLPISQTHLYLRVSGEVVEIGPALSAWLRSCSQLQFLWCDLYDNVPYYHYDMHTLKDALLQYVPDSLTSLPDLKAVHIDGDSGRLLEVKLLAQHTSLAINHICLSRYHLPSHFIHHSEYLLSRRIRGKITSVCCMRFKSKFDDVSALPGFFPNLRRVEILGNVPDKSMGSLCTTYKELIGGCPGADERERQLRITVFLRSLPAPVLVESGLVEIRHVPFQSDIKSCMIRRQMECP